MIPLGGSLQLASVSGRLAPLLTKPISEETLASYTLQHGDTTFCALNDDRWKLPDLAACTLASLE